MTIDLIDQQPGECNYKQPALHAKDANGSTLVAVNGSLDPKIVGIWFGCRIYANSESYYYTTKMVSECWTVWERMVYLGNEFWIVWKEQFSARMEQFLLGMECFKIRNEWFSYRTEHFGPRNKQFVDVHIIGMGGSDYFPLSYSGSNRVEDVKSLVSACFSYIA